MRSESIRRVWLWRSVEPDDQNGYVASLAACSNTGHTDIPGGFSDAPVIYKSGQAFCNATVTVYTLTGRCFCRTLCHYFRPLII